MPLAFPVSKQLPRRTSGPCFPGQLILLGGRLASSHTAVKMKMAVSVERWMLMFPIRGLRYGLTSCHECHTMHTELTSSPAYWGFGEELTPKKVGDNKKYQARTSCIYIIPCTYSPSPIAHLLGRRVRGLLLRKTALGLCHLHFPC